MRTIYLTIASLDGLRADEGDALEWLFDEPRDGQANRT